MQLNNRLKRIIEIVRKEQPISGEQIASLLGLTRATLRPDLAILTMSGILGARPKVGYFYIGLEEDAVIATKLKELIVKEYMSLPIIVTDETTVYDTIVSMFLEDVGSIFVTHGGYLTGVVSRKDLLKATIGGNDINKLPVAFIMTRLPHIITIKEDDRVSLAAKRIVEQEIDSLPVILETELGFKVIGRITKTTITRLFLDLSNE